MFNRFIKVKCDYWCSFKRQSSSDLTPEKWSSALQSAVRLLAPVFVTERCEEYAGVLKVRRHPHAGDCDEADAGIIYAASE